MFLFRFVKQQEWFKLGKTSMHAFWNNESHSAWDHKMDPSHPHNGGHLLLCFSLLFQNHFIQWGFFSNKLILGKGTSDFLTEIINRKGEYPLSPNP